MANDKGTNLDKREERDRERERGVLMAIIIIERAFSPQRIE